MGTRLLWIIWAVVLVTLVLSIVVFTAILSLSGRMALRDVLDVLLMPWVVMTFVMMIAAALLSVVVARRFVGPINSLDLDHPLDNETYDELEPLLRRMDRQNENLTAQMQEVAAGRREFTANVSHELKTPLTVISGYAELMSNGAVEAEDVPRFSALIHDEAMHLQQLVEDILMLSQLDEGAGGEQSGYVDLADVAQGVVHRLQPFARQNDVTLAIEVAQPTRLWGLRRVLETLVYNLCENAVRYNRPGGLVTVRVGPYPDGSAPRGVELSVADTGIGIDESLQERVFERFYRVDETRSRDTGGTGLGLAIVKHAAQYHDADLQLASRPGEGTTVTVRF